MTQRPITWSSEELYAGWDKADIPTGGVCPYVSGELYRFLAALGAVHPAEAREMQREAWVAAERFEVAGTGFAWSVPTQRQIAERDRLYPSLLPQSPPPLVLSTGTWTWEADYSGWTRENSLCDRGGYPSPTIRTASDARKLADWLQQYGSAEERK